MSGRRRVALLAAVVVGLPVACVLAHLAFIEIGKEVVVLRTRNAEGRTHSARLWVVDYEGYAWVHGRDSRWLQDIEENPVVEVERAGERRRYLAVPVPGPHPHLHELLREKYGLADSWVRWLAGDEGTVPVRLEHFRATLGRPTLSVR